MFHWITRKYLDNTIKEEVDRQIKAHDYQHVEQCIESMFKRHMGRYLHDENNILAEKVSMAAKQLTDEEREEMKASIKKEMVKHIEEMRVHMHHASNNYDNYGGYRWWEQWPFSDTIGSEAFLDMLAERLNKKQLIPRANDAQMHGK